MKRRKALKAAAVTTGGLLLNLKSNAANRISVMENTTLKLKENFKHSVSRWCFNDIPLEQFCQTVAGYGMHSIELTGPEEWQVMKKYGLTCAIGWDKYPEGVGLDNFFTNPDNHAALQKYYRDLIPKAVKAGVTNLIAIAGQRRGRSDYENLIHCKNGLKPVVKMAEDNGITISMEYLNSKVNHPDHQFDNMEWGVALCEMLGAPNFKILYDIYHAQIMEGDVVATIRKYADYISHYHTAGVPGRHEIDDTQELNYRFIMEEIKKTGYTGFIGQEFIPSGKTQQEKLAALKMAVTICDV